MLFRTIESTIRQHLASGTEKILLVDGARQVGKTTSVRRVGRAMFPNFIEVNMLEDALHDKLFASVRKKEDFYLQLSMIAGDKMGSHEDTLVFIDEIQAYPELLTLLKFLADDKRFTYVASGSLLGVTLAETSSIPMGRIRLLRMHPLSFVEFLRANGLGEAALQAVGSRLRQGESLDSAMHERMTALFRKYLLVGGLPEAVVAFLETQNIQRVRAIHQEISSFYALDAAKYDAARRLKIRRIYELIPSTMENKSKRIVVGKIEERSGRTFKHYEDEFDYLSASGIAIPVRAVANPRFPLAQTARKSFLKFYLNDVGLLSSALFGPNIRAILDDVPSIDLGAVYETVVATELTAYGYPLAYYYDRAKGEVDYLIDDFDSLSVVPIEVKSGRSYRTHSALDALLATPNACVKRGLVLSNAREIETRGKIDYRPVYALPFILPSPPAPAFMI